MMHIIIIVTVLLILAAVAAVRRLRRNRALAVMQNSSMKVTGQAFSEAVRNVQSPGFDGKNAGGKPRVELISDVWGKGVMAFEYSLDAPEVMTGELAGIRRKMTDELGRYASAHGMTGWAGGPCFVVSDIWIFAGVLHIDVSHVINQATADYLHDIRKGEGR